MSLLWSSSELASHDFPEPAYLVEPMIPQGGTVLLHGKPGVGKTQLILSLAHAVNTGTDWLARWPTRQGPVVVIQADMTGQIQQERVSRVVDSLDISHTYWAVEPDGSIPYINIQTLTIQQRQLVAQIREVDPILIVWDTLRKIHRLPENVSESPIIVYSTAHELFPKATHLFVHHPRKASRDPDALDTSDEDFMGNQQWKGAADAQLSLTEIGSTSVPKRARLTFHKARTAPDTEKQPLILELDHSTITLLPTYDPR